MSPGLVDFSKRIGIVAGAMISVGIVVSVVWGLATKPIVDTIAEERRARVTADSLIIQSLDHVSLQVANIGVALASDPGSSAQRLAGARASVPAFLTPPTIPTVKP